MTVHAHIRVHYDELEHVADFIIDKSQDYMVVIEEASRQHLHAYTHSIYTSVDCIRRAIKLAFPKLKGNGSFSVSELREAPERLCAYLMKQDGSKQTQLPVNVMEQAKQIKTEYDEKATRRTAPKTVFAQLVKDMPPGTTKEETVRFIMRWFRSRRKLQPDIFQMRRYVNTIRYMNNPWQEEARMLAELGVADTQSESTSLDAAGYPLEEPREAHLSIFEGYK